ncbi:MAG: hypothetical protein HKL99_07245 [Burkholderiales bacterium]|nr:hypothetical protein [Burkholderiales bacterium]
MHHYDIAHMIVSSLIHGLVYATIFKAFRHMSLGEAVAVTAAGIGAIWMTSTLLRRR